MFRAGRRFFSAASLALIVVQNMVVAASRDATDRLIRGLTWVNLLAVGALVALYAFYRVPPPLVTLAVIEALFVLSLVLPPHASGAQGVA